MANTNPDISERHDPLKERQEENEEFAALEEEVTGTSEVTAAEESAVNIDNETARDADFGMGPEEGEDAELEREAKLVEEATERKHKNRESTSEKARRAAAERVAVGKTAEPVSSRTLDPLRLRGKKYRQAVAKVDKNQAYPVEEAIRLVQETSTSSFDAAVELHCKVKADTVRGTVVLPHGTGKSKRVAVADDETLEAIAAGKLDFEVLLATPAQMPKLARYAKLLGPKGLMPSPKAGTVTDDVEQVKAEISSGRIEYRADKNGVVHATIGRVSFPAESLLENYRALEQVLASSKVISASLASTMGPGVRVAIGR